MQQPIFFGEFKIRFDQRCRLTLPAEVRRQLKAEVDGTAVMAVVGSNDKLWLYPDRYYEQLIYASPEALKPTDRGSTGIAFALASRLEPDAKGRLLIPQRIIRTHGLERDVTLIGAKNHLEIWRPADWDQQREQLLEHLRRPD